MGALPLHAWFETLCGAEETQHPGVSSLAAHIGHILPKYQFADHLMQVIALLEAVERGDEDRVMIIMPPRHGKTWTCSHLFPTWFMGKHPDLEFIHVGHTERFARGYGRRVRNLMNSDLYRDVFPNLHMSKDSQAADLWHTSEDGVYVAAGVGSAIAGRGGDCVLIDDPIRGREDADSETQREKAWDWYTNDLHTRLHPKARIVVIQTRWHDDDLAGRLLEAQANDEDADHWTVLHHPALTEDGKALWPERFSARWMERKRANIGARAWSSLYQGDPAPDDGAFFDRSWIRQEPAPPAEHMRIYAASDLATKHDEGDWTVHMVCGLDPQKRLWVLDMWRKKTNAEAWVDQWVRMSDRWKPMLWIGEKGQIESTVGPFLSRVFRERGVLQRRELLPNVNDKPTRARGIQAWMEQNGLWLPSSAPWAPTLINELLRFPTGKHDDIVDTLSLIGRMLEIMLKGKVPPAPEPEVINTRFPTMNELWKETDQRRSAW